MQNQENLDYNEPLKEELENLPDENLPPSPNNPPWTWPAALGTWIASVIFILVLPIFTLFPYLYVKGVDLSDSQAMQSALQTDTTALLISILTVIPAHALTLLLAWLVITNYKKYDFREMVGWQSDGFAWWHYLLILGGLFIVAAGFSYVVPPQENEMTKMLANSRAAVYAVAFLATFTAPLVEEVIYRGILYSALQKKLGVIFAVIATTLLFALVHVPQYYPSFFTIIMICFLSLVLTLVRVKADNLLPCIILHTLINGIQAYVLIVEPFVSNPQQKAETAAAALIKLVT